ncbi:MAG: hypothetical protein U5P10_08195 [Spirochaetia bacterium]|nr:hypothetical protein [Spirochaetia bacterium]
MMDEHTAAELFTHAMEVEPRSVTPMGYGRFSDSFRIEAPGASAPAQGSAPAAGPTDSRTTRNDNRGSNTGSFVLRIAPPDSLLQLFYEYRMMRQEPEIHRRVLEETDVPVPRNSGPRFSRRKIDRDFLVMELMPGRPLTRIRPAGFCPGDGRAGRDGPSCTGCGSRRTDSAMWEPITACRRSRTGSRPFSRCTGASSTVL